MTILGGIWIDHQRAVIVELAHDTHHATMLPSKVQEQLEHRVDMPLRGNYTMREIRADAGSPRLTPAALENFYDAVIKSLDGTDNVVVFGPGMAKSQLKKRLSHAKPSLSVLAVENAEKMTDKEVVAKVLGYFGQDAPRMQ